MLVVGKVEPAIVHEAIATVEHATTAQRKLAELTTEMFDAFAASRLDDCSRLLAEIDHAFGPSKLTARYTDEIAARRSLPPDPAFRGEIQLSAK